MTEIKISDLSVGDWVRVDDFDKVLIKRVSAIDGTRNQIGIIKNNRSGIYWYYDDEFEPIPLTPEILEKNGWKKIVRNIKYQTWVKGDIYIRKYSAEEWYRLFIGRFEMKFNLYHTHQLQHALRLAGIGKEIEL